MNEDSNSNTYTNDLVLPINVDDNQDNLIAQLSSLGLPGLSAATAILSTKHPKNTFKFETNATSRKRQQTRILRKLKDLVDELASRCGQQICIVCCTPSKQSAKNGDYKVFGTQPLENVLKNEKVNVLNDFDNILKNTMLEQPNRNVSKTNEYDLPPLAFDGIPTTLDEMTQSQLRMFIPICLKYSTGRNKPGWGKQQFRPSWWPNDLPWANVRIDPRDDESKKQIPWTEVLKTVIRNCYSYHGREDLLNSKTQLNTFNSKIKILSSTLNTTKKIRLDTSNQFDEIQNNINGKQEYPDLHELAGSPILINNETDQMSASSGNTNCEEENCNFSKAENEQYRQIWLTLKNIHQDPTSDNINPNKILIGENGLQVENHVNEIESEDNDNEIYRLIK